MSNQHTNQPDHIADVRNMVTDTNQASEKLRKSVEQCFIKNNMCDCGGEHNALNIDETEYFDVESVVNDVISLIHTEKLKLLDEVIHQSTVNLKSAKAVAGWAELRKKQLEAEL